MALEEETFLTLVQDKAHWQFELFLIALFDGVIGLVLWPWIKKFIIHHKSDDERIVELEKKVEKLSK
ncbi:MAG: hypothetical protein Q7S54_00125 [bacterium]|nr:hypothetical protein [bacterium]